MKERLQYILENSDTVSASHACRVGIRLIERIIKLEQEGGSLVLVDAEGNESGVWMLM